MSQKVSRNHSLIMRRDISLRLRLTAAIGTAGWQI